ncbi:peptidylprolyl isomerase [Virgibacillus ndiopensis]|uniref:peptidylprolyl isomerase n=1 Tax=Virgibacillus ndiopensis TaxID=2004408 RepID=UPI000C07E84A|nr:peptidylprolyl isomerase [Virgibacillus ndiopensis]
MKVLYWIGGAVIAVALIVCIFILNKDSYVARVNGEKISKDELNETLVSQYGPDVLNSLINQKVIEAEIEKEGIKVSQEEIDEEMTEYEEYYGGEEAFQSVLESNGTDISTVEKDIELYLATNKLMADDIEITDEEMKTYFEENKDSFSQQEEVQASHILLDDEETANKVIEKLDAGEDFAELAAEYSTDTSTAESGGELGYFGKGEMEEAFEDTAFSLEVDTYSEPVKTEYGYHIIKVTDHNQAKEATFEDAKEEIKETLFEQKVQELYDTWMQETLAGYDVENNLEKD